MWISRKLTENSSYHTAERGRITVSNKDKLEADGSLNTRNVISYSPYGYSSLPPKGEEVLLLPFSNGQVAVGTRDRQDKLNSGEVRISSAGGASIVLKNDGSVVINNRFVINKEGEISGGI